MADRIAVHWPHGHECEVRFGGDEVRFAQLRVFSRTSDGTPMVPCEYTFDEQGAIDLALRILRDVTLALVSPAEHLARFVEMARAFLALLNHRDRVRYLSAIRVTYPEAADLLLEPPALHFVGFRGDEYRSAVAAFGPPDFFHRVWDVRAVQEVAEGDTVVFARYHDRLPSPYSHDDSAWPDDPATMERNERDK